MSDKVIELDALIVGAGFGGVYQLKRLRDEGFNVKLVGAGSDFGGVWYWNRYPGARVDTPTPHYEFSDPDLWSEWAWSQRFPGGAEILEYFAYVASEWNLRKDCDFETTVTKATWSEDDNRWIVETQIGTTYKTQFLLANTGFAAKRHIPDWKGVDSFQGVLVHSSYWPKEGIDLSGKRAAVIGTGATGIQLCQAIAPIASEFAVFQRTPNTCMPMGQVDFARKDLHLRDQRLASIFAEHPASYSGLDYNFMDRKTFDDSAEERRKVYEELWRHGDFHFWLGTYSDMLFDDKANDEAYNFWREKVRARISDTGLHEKLAPTRKPHAFGCKRISLEDGFYELFDKPHVHLVGANETPIVEITPTGIQTSERHWDFDVVVCATGYDAVTGGFMEMNMTGRNGLRLQDHWRDSLKTYLGMSIADFPNLFFTYGPQAPTALCNGPSCAELQGEWIVSVLKYMREHRKSVVNAEQTSERTWAETVKAMANSSLLPSAKSWYMGDNIPGKIREPLFFIGGVPMYYKTIQDVAEKGYEGFQLT